MQRLLVILALTFPLTSQANDGYAAISSGGIQFQKSEAIQMKTEVLTISTDKITVDYEFQNDSKDPIETVVAFPIPEITCGYWGVNKGIDDFTVQVDGKSIHPTREIKAFNLVDAEHPAKRGDKDLTDVVKKAGLPLDCRITKNDDKLLAKAKKKKLAEDFKGTDPEDILYTTRINYWWKQKFEPGKIVKIRHSYTPLVGGGIGGLGDYYLEKNLSWDRDIHLHDVTDKTGFTTKMSDINQYTVVNYILTTANTWKGPIGKFTLVLKRSTPSVFVGSTLGPLTTVNPETVKFEAKDFTPKNDLFVIFSKL